MENVTIFVSTYDLYQPVWKFFCYSLKKYWPDCPWPVRFLTNKLDSPCGETLKVGDDINWTAMQRHGLEQIQTKVALITHSDLWYTAPVDTQAMVEFARLVEEDKADRIYLVKGGDHQNPKTFELDDRLGVYPPRSLYRTGTHALWNVNTLLSLMGTGEDAWEFEKRANVRSRSTQAVFLFCKKYCYIPYLGRGGAVKRGKWTTSAREYAAREGLSINFSHHPDGTIGRP